MNLNQIIESKKEPIEGKLFAYLGGMNLLGVMNGKTTDRTITQRDTAVEDILEEVEKAIRESVEEALREVKVNMVVDFDSKKGYKSAIEDLYARVKEFMK